MKGYSLHVGVGEVDFDHYLSTYKVIGPEKDAKDLYDITSNINGYEKSYLLTSSGNGRAKATSKNFFNTLDYIIEETKKNGEEESYVVISFSGHGARYEHQHKLKRKVEFLCFYDKMVLEHEIKVELLKFPKGVKCFIIVDCCYSDGITKSGYGLGTLTIESLSQELSKEEKEAITERERGILNSIKRMTGDQAKGVIELNHKEYLDKIETVPAIISARQFRSSICFLSACDKDKKTGAADCANGNSFFTHKLLSIWNDGQFDGNYNMLHTFLAKKTGLKGGARISGAYAPFFITTVPFDFNREY
jgi:hypothetical protein